MSTCKTGVLAGWSVLTSFLGEELSGTSFVYLSISCTSFSLKPLSCLCLVTSLPSSKGPPSSPAASTTEGHSVPAPLPVPRPSLWQGLLFSCCPSHRCPESRMGQVIQGLTQNFTRKKALEGPRSKSSLRPPFFSGNLS